MITITSTVNPAYSAAVYPVKQYKGGNGYYFYYTADGPNHNAIVSSDLPRDVLQELRPKVEQAWSS